MSGSSLTAAELAERLASVPPRWKHVNGGRLFVCVEESIDAGTKWAVSEPNGEARA